jgi:hypothetical protein
MNHVSHISSFKLVNLLHVFTCLIWFTQQKERNYFDTYKTYKFI